MSARPIVNIVCVGAVYIDTIWTVPNFPAEDTKLRAETVERRRGGNVANTLEVLEQIVQAHCDSVPDGTKDESIRLPRTRLYLMSALPDRNSEDAAFISQRLPNVLIRDIFRDNCPKSPASMIIQNRTTASRTIISHGSGVEELTAPEFVNGIDFWSNAWPTDHKDALRKTWVHFEGRNPTITHDCIAKLRNTKFETHTEVKISVECEKPERKALEQAAQLADVVFYSKLWAEDCGYTTPENFLVHISKTVEFDQKNVLLVCTWGADGASALQLETRPRYLPKKLEMVSCRSTSNPDDPAARVVDTIGAGDTFIAGLLFQLTNNAESTLESKLQYAVEIASRKVYREGFQGLGKEMKLLPWK